MDEIFEVEEVIVTTSGKTYFLSGIRIRSVDQQPIVRLEGINLHYYPNDRVEIKFPEGKRKVKLKKTPKGYVLEDLNNE